MSLSFKEETVSQPWEGEALSSEWKEALFSDPQAHGSQWDTYTKVHLPPSTSPSCDPRWMDTRPANHDRVVVHLGNLGLTGRK